MAQKKGASATGIGVGGSSILAVFVILCLTTFATLSLVSARADLRLTQRSAQSVTLYYQADAQAQTLLAQLASLHSKAPSTQQFVEKAVTYQYVTACTEAAGGSISFSFSVPMDELRSLEGHAVLDSQGTMRVEQYQVTTAQGDLVLEDSVELWDGQLPA